MTRTAICLVATLLLFGASSTAIAHPGHSHGKSTSGDDKSVAMTNRIWTASTGAFRERGSFVMVKDGMVQIRRGDDSLVMLPISLLLRDDQAVIERRVAEIRRASELIRPALFESRRSNLPDGLFDLNGRELRSNAIPKVLFLGDNLNRPIIKGIGEKDSPLLLAQLGQQQARGEDRMVPEMARTFEAFVKTKAIKTRWDDDYFYVESNGIPAHQMMVGITSWQQQVPLPQKYVGANAWQIPLQPVPAKNPQSTKGHFLRGAIALAANGVPIFNPLNNRGEDAFLFGELDEFGGHCGRGDDYHYHLAPVHLQKTVGKGLPIAYALDGYPIYGYEEPDGSPVVGLDKWNGHQDKNGNYHYHATKTYPYLNGGFYGEVTERGGQVDPQPRAEPVRPDLRPLRDAKITDFKETKSGSFLLTYDVKGKKGTVAYSLAENGSVTFTYSDTSGKTTNETYSPRRRGPGGQDRPPPPPRRKGDRPPPRDD